MDLLKNGNQFIKSNESATPTPGAKGKGYGQNGFGGASSDTDIHNGTKSGFVDTCDGVPYHNDQTRHDVSREPLPTTFGMKNPNASPVKVPDNNRPVKR